MVDINKMISKYSTPKIDSLDSWFNLLNEVAETVSKNDLIIEQEESRFSYSIAIPKLVPNEAWGDPSAQSRKEIERVFSVVRGGNNIQERIADINKFLTPKSAKRKTSANVILNMMMIVEALQATLNDYNESAAGFVFEGFMAALTGGKQIAGRIRGTLPIEDFVAFSEIGDADPVSLKLLGPDTPTEGSFTNLVDYLFARGADKITYLVTYKAVVGGKVENLVIFDFVLIRENFVDALYPSNEKVFGSLQNAEALKQAAQSWDGKPKGLMPVAMALKDIPGYTKKGMLYAMARGGEAYVPPEDEVDIEDLPPEQREREERIRALKLDYERLATKKAKSFRIATDYDSGRSKEEIKQREQEIKKQVAAIEQELQSLGASINESRFHEREKLLMKEEKILMESGGSTGTQWSITRDAMNKMKDLINMRTYGTLDLSQKNIDELVKIYSKILGDSLRKLLQNTKDLTENIGRYYSERMRSDAMEANKESQDQSQEIVKLLQKDPRYSKEEENQETT